MVEVATIVIGVIVVVAIVAIVALVASGVTVAIVLAVVLGASPYNNPRVEGMQLQQHQNMPEFVSAAGELKGEIRLKYRTITLKDYNMNRRWDKTLPRFIDRKESVRNLESTHGGVTTFTFPGPTFRLKKDHFKATVTYRNQIDKKSVEKWPSGCNKSEWPEYAYPNCFHKDDLTNIHYHGSHISPNGHGDSIFAALYPEKATVSAHDLHNPLVAKGSWVSHLTFPTSQMPGTHWYHPHIHGSTHLSVADGVAGALIIEGDFAGIKEIENAQQKIFTIQRKGQLNYFNGKLSPIVTMKPGEVQRWRFISAVGETEKHWDLGWEDNKGVRIPSGEKQPLLYPIAIDGVEFLDAQWQHVLANRSHWVQHDLIAGGRYDYLIKAPLAPGPYYLVQFKHEVNETEDPPVIIYEPAEHEIPPMIIVNVEGAVNDMPLPKNLRTYAQLTAGQQRAVKPILDSDIVRRRTIDYGIDWPLFHVNGNTWVQTRVDHCVVLGTSEEWTITSSSTSPKVHPFHIHINPFFVTHWYDGSRTDNPNADGERGKLELWDHRRRWQDTVGVPVSTNNATNPSFVKVRMRFLDFTGTFVQHCHILVHEDRGMMQNIIIYPANATLAQCITHERTGTFAAQ